MIWPQVGILAIYKATSLPQGAAQLTRRGQCVLESARNGVGRDRLRTQLIEAGPNANNKQCCPHNTPHSARQLEYYADSNCCQLQQSWRQIWSELWRKDLLTQFVKSRRLCVQYSLAAWCWSCWMWWQLWEATMLQTPPFSYQRHHQWCTTVALTIPEEPPTNIGWSTILCSTGAQSHIQI